LCAREFAATQYALLSSVPQLAIHTIGGASGLMAASLGWTLFYAVCMAGALPGMLLMVVLLRRHDRAAAPTPGKGAAGFADDGDPQDRAAAPTPAKAGRPLEPSN
jgi:hypothetical protein